MQDIIVIRRPWVKWAIAVGVAIGIIVALNTGFNPKADHQFTVRAVQFGAGFWVFLAVLIYGTKGVGFKTVGTRSFADQEKFDPERERLVLRQQTDIRSRSLSGK